MTNRHRADLELALALAHEAGALTLEHFRRDDLVVERKGDGSPVTIADRAAEALIRSRLADERPDDAVVGEEHDDTSGTSTRTWVVDPIDGTKSFTHGVANYSTLVALLEDGEPVVGVIHLPALSETVWASVGGGCHSERGVVSVDRRAELDGSFVMTSGFGYWPDGLASRAMARSRVVWETWGDAYGYALVATGRVQAMFDPIVNLWDVAPVKVIIEEAGGRFTDLSGKARIDGGSGLATNGLIHDELLALLRSLARDEAGR